MKKFTTWSVVGIAFALMFCTCELDAQTKTVDYVRSDGSATRVKYEKDLFGKTNVTSTYVSADQRESESNAAQTLVGGALKLVYSPAILLWDAGKEKDSTALKTAAVVVGGAITLLGGLLLF